MGNLTLSDLLKLIPLHHLPYQPALLLAEVRQVVEAGELRLEDGRHGGVHIPEEEDDIICEDAGRSLEAYLFHLKGVLVQIPQVADAVLQKLLSLLKLAPHEDEASVVEAEPDEIGALVG